MNSDLFHSADFMNCGSIVGWAVPTKRQSEAIPQVFTIQFSLYFACDPYLPPKLSSEISMAAALVARMEFIFPKVTGRTVQVKYSTDLSWPW